MDNSEYELGLLISIDNHDKEKIIDILNSKIDVNYAYVTSDPTYNRFNGFTPLTLSIVIGNEDAVDLLLKHNADPNYGGTKYPIERAIKYNRHEIFESLVKSGLDIRRTIWAVGARYEYTTYSPLAYAIENNTNDIIQLLLHHDKNLTPREQTCAYMSALIKMFIHDSTYDLLYPSHFPDRLIDSAFLTAVKYARYREVKKLLDGGANIDTKNFSGETALIIATKGGYLHIIKFLIYRKNHINRVPSVIEQDLPVIYPRMSLIPHDWLRENGWILETLCSFKNDIHNYFNIICLDIFDYIFNHVLLVVCC